MYYLLPHQISPGTESPHHLARTWGHQSKVKWGQNTEMTSTENVLSPPSEPESFTYIWQNLTTETLSKILNHRQNMGTIFRLWTGHFHLQQTFFNKHFHKMTAGHMSRERTQDFAVSLHPNRLISQAILCTDEHESFCLNPLTYKVLN